VFFTHSRLSAVACPQVASAPNASTIAGDLPPAPTAQMQPYAPALRVITANETPLISHASPGHVVSGRPPLHGQPPSSLLHVPHLPSAVDTPTNAASSPKSNMRYSGSVLLNLVSNELSLITT
jgi:hypothetical protein